MPDYDLVVVGSGFAGSAAALSFLETAEKAGRSGRVALVESGKNGTWPGASRWAKPFLALDRDNKLLRGRAGRVEWSLSSLVEYWRRLEDETPNTVKFMEDHGVKLIHHDEEDAALDFEEQHFAYTVGGGKEIVAFFLSHVANHENADVLWDHEAVNLTLDENGERVNGIVACKPDGALRSITADTVALACGGFEGNP